MSMNYADCDVVEGKQRRIEPHMRLLEAAGIKR